MLIDILIVVLIISVITMVVFVSLSLRKISDQAIAMRKDIHQLVENSLPVLANLKEITKRTNHIVTEVEVYWKEIDHSIKTVRQRISLITSAESYRSLENPVNFAIKFVSAILRGTSAFLNIYKHK
jgi:uncharacterized protein YoxC